MGFNQGEIVSGQTAMSDDGEPRHAGDMAAQLALSLDNLEAILSEAGMSLANLVRLNVYTTDVDLLFQHYGVLPSQTGTAALTHLLRPHQLSSTATPSPAPTQAPPSVPSTGTAGIRQKGRGYGRARVVAGGRCHDLADGAASRCLPQIIGRYLREPCPIPGRRGPCRYPLQPGISGGFSAAITAPASMVALRLFDEFMSATRTEPQR